MPTLASNSAAPANTPSKIMYSRRRASDAERTCSSVSIFEIAWFLFTAQIAAFTAGTRRNKSPSLRTTSVLKSCGN